MDRYLKDLLLSLDIEIALSYLSETNRLIVELMYAYRCPRDYKLEWPPTSESIGRYLATRLGRKRPLTERAIQKRHNKAIAVMHTHMERLSNAWR